MPQLPTAQDITPTSSVEQNTPAPAKRRFTLAKPTVTYEEVVEWIKAHPGGCPRQMCKQKKDFKNKLVYFFLFGEVFNNYCRNTRNVRIRTQWVVIGDGLGYPCQQLHYWWIF